MALALLITLLAAGRGAAQNGDDVDVDRLFQYPQVGARLTIRPHEMATGTRTEQAGTFPIPQVNGLLYVPPRCVGVQRCPLLVHLPPGQSPEQMVDEWLQPAADRFGIILLVSSDPLLWRNPEFASAQGPVPSTEQLDDALRDVLQHYAIDPAKIAILGHCGTGGSAWIWANSNWDVFSRLIVNSGPGSRRYRLDPGHKGVAVFFDSGFLEFMAPNGVAAAADLREEGYPTKHWLRVGDHGHQVEDYLSIAQWLQESWGALRPAPAVVADPLPLLTPAALQQMTTFWTRFQEEPDSIRTTARQAYLREVIVPVGVKDAPPSTGMVDMAALAAQYPSVAAELKAAGLTAAQHDAYRLALFTALFLQEVQNPADMPFKRLHPSLVVPDGSVLAKNLAFVTGHPDEVQALAQSDIWMTP